jgi:hypothetical protein
MNMTNDKWKPCNDMIGRILTYLDEDESSRATKKAIKTEIWDFYNEHVNGDDNDNEQETHGNR